MKPFFTNLFKPLITRTGTAIGKAAERTMLQAVEGPGTIRKLFQTNPDGSTTMLHTQNGIARFAKSGNVAKNQFTINNAQLYMPYGSAHHFFGAEVEWNKPFRMWLENPLKIPNLAIAGFTYPGFSISGDVVTPPNGWQSFPELSVHVTLSSWPGYEQYIGHSAYKIHIGPSRSSRPDVFADGIVSLV